MPYGSCYILALYVSFPRWSLVEGAHDWTHKIVLQRLVNTERRIVTEIEDRLAIRIVLECCERVRGSSVNARDDI